MSSLNLSNPFDVEVAKAAGNGNTVGVIPPASPCEMMIWGTFGGGTVKVQRSPDSTDGANGTWIDVPGASYTAATAFVIEVGSGNRLRLNVAGGTSPSINSTLSPC